MNIDPRGRCAPRDRAHEGRARGAPVRPARAARGAARRCRMIEDAAGALGASLPRRAVRRPRPARLLLVPSAQDRHHRRGRRGHDRRRGHRRTRALAPPSRLVAVARLRRHAVGPRTTTASATSSARSGSRSCAGSTSCSRRASASPPATRSGSRISTRAAGGGPGRPPRLAGVRRPGRPPRRGDGGAPRAGDPVPDRHVRAAPARRLPRPGPVPRAPTPPSSGRSRCRSHARLTEGELDRVAEALDKIVSHH